MSPSLNQIRITFRDGKWFTDPNPAIVLVGTKIRWILRAPELSKRRLLWKIDFKTRSPFGEKHSLLKVVTKKTVFPPHLLRDQMAKLFSENNRDLKNDILADHRGATEPLPADTAGDYKYDLRVEDAATGISLGDEDPMLFVVTGILLPNRTVELRDQDR